VIEIKNYLDKPCAESGLKILNEIRHAITDKNTKFALFSYSEINVRASDVRKNLKEFQHTKNCYLIT